MKKLLLTLLLLSSLPAWAVNYPDLPDCDALWASDGGYRLGIALPGEDPELATRVEELSRFYEDVAGCRLDWNTLLPRYAPWSPVPELEKYHGYAIFALALLLASLMYTLLPRRWRRQVTLLGILAIASVTWLLGVGGLALANYLELPQKLLYKDVVLLEESEGDPRWLEVTGIWELDRQLMAAGLKPDMTITRLTGQPRHEQLTVRTGTEADSVTHTLESARSLVLKPTGQHRVVNDELLVKVSLTGLPAATDLPEAWVAWDDIEIKPEVENPVGKTFIVFRPTNIREKPGVQHPRLPGSPVHKGAKVSVIGPVQGDWWKVKVADSGQEGWMSSLWLRRPAEARGEDQ